MVLVANLSIQMKVDLDADVGGNRFAVFRGWFEAVFLDGFEGFFVEAEAEGARDLRIPWVAVGVDDDRDDADSLILLAARLVGEFCDGSEEHRRFGDAAGSRCISQPSGDALGAWTITWAFS